MVKNAQELGNVILPALNAAASGRPGPVLIEYSPDSVGQQNGLLSLRQKETKPGRLEKSLELAKQYLEKAIKPVFFIGSGTISSGASELLTEMARQARIPVVSSLMGIGAFSGTDPLYLGMLGMHGTFAANKAVHHSDLLVCIGVRFSDRASGKVSGFSPKSKKIHVDIDAAEINKIIRVDLPIVSDAKEFLKGLKEVLDDDRIRGNTEIWVNEVTHLKRTVQQASEQVRRRRQKK